MGIFQEAAILAGDVVTQPIRKFVAEKITGYNFKIIRKIEPDYSLEALQKRSRVYRVTWN